MAGLEPARLLGQGILSPRCLPFHHIRSTRVSISLWQTMRKGMIFEIAWLRRLP